MRIVDIATADTPRGGRLGARVLWDDPRLEPDLIEYLYRDTPAAAITNPGDALLAAMLVPAMAVGEDIRIEAPVSARLVDGAAKIGQTMTRWYPKFRLSRVAAPVPAEPPPRPTEVASTFSGGLDSFYTVLRPRDDPITVVFTIIGFDLRFEKRAAVPVVIPRLEQAAKALGLRVIVVDSNAYEVGHKYVFKAEHHGGFLASTALALGGSIRRFFIPSSWWDWDMRPWGSHPHTDPLWSTETLEVVHDGAYSHRLDKAREVSANPVLLDHLRVCISRPEEYNCGRCTKCVATALVLHVAGTLDKCATLGPLDLRVIRRTPISADYQRAVADHVRGSISERELYAAVQRALMLGRLLKAAGPILNVIRRRRLRSRTRDLSSSKAEAT